MVITFISTHSDVITNRPIGPRHRAPHIWGLAHTTFGKQCFDEKSMIYVNKTYAYVCLFVRCVPVISFYILV